MPLADTDARDAVLLVQDVVASGPDGGALRWSTRSLKGGLTTDLLLVAARTPAGRLEQYVLKRVPPQCSREARAYAALAACGLSDLAPRLLAAPSLAGSDYLLLEYVPRWKAWPWADETYAGMVLDTLARLHAAALPAGRPIEPWHTGELGAAADYTSGLLRAAVAATGDDRLRRGAGHLEMFLERLADLHAWLLQAPVFLHGDVHPGNVVIRTGGGPRRAVLVDWGRSRPGSRFEDVASWLQCLRYYERASVGAHDRLLRRYVRAAGLGDRITPALRREYWIAAGCNAVAGALGVHLARLLAARTSAPRERARAAALDWLRIVRRAAAYMDRR